MAAINQIIDGKYEILQLINKGGMSAVYLARDKRLNKLWAVKEIIKKENDRNNAINVQAAIDEANMIKALDHPKLPRIVDIIDNGNVIYIIMDYIEGQSLQDLIKDGTPQEQDVVIDWAKQLAEVLQYLHTLEHPIIHRDMKPANVMLKPDGSLKLIDFGIAREYKAEKVEDTTYLGTKGYAAPEQFGGKGQTDARTDIYCLGVTLHHLITGHDPNEPPYELYPIRHYNPALSSGLETIIQKCIQLNPADRYQSCAELLYDLEHYDELDEEYRRGQISKLKKFVIMASIAVICAIFGSAFLIINSMDVNRQYLNAINAAKNSSILYSDDATQRDTKDYYYREAINLKPDTLRNPFNDGQGDNPYFEVINECMNVAAKDDENHNNADSVIETIFGATGPYTQHLSGLERERRFSELNLRLVEYQLLYSGKTTMDERIAVASGYLENAKERTNTLSEEDRELFDTYGAFMKQYQDIQKLTANPTGSQLKETFDSILGTIQNAKDSNNINLKFNIFQFTLILFTQDDKIMEYLQTAGVSVDEMNNLYKIIDSSAQSTTFTREQKEQLQTQLGIFNEKIATYYGGND